MINVNALDALRPLAGILADYDTACAEAERIMADARNRAEEKLRALGIADLSALVPAAAPAAPLVATPAPEAPAAALRTRHGKPEHPCADGCGRMTFRTRCRECNGRHVRRQQMAEKQAQAGGSVLTLPGSEPAPDASSDGDGGKPTPPPAPADAPIPAYSKAPEMGEVHARAIMAARACGIQNKRADEAGEFLVIRLTPAQMGNGVGGFVAVTDGQIPQGVEVIERVTRRGQDWFIRLPGEDVRIGRRQAGALVPVSIPTNGATAHASA